MQERVDNLQALNSLGALLTLARGNGFSKLFGSSSKVDTVEQVADGLCAHAALEVVGIVQAHLAIQGFVGYELLGLDLQESLQSLRTQGLALVELLVDVSDFLFDFLGRHTLVFVDVINKLVLFGNVVDGQTARSLDETIALCVQFFQVCGKFVAQLFYVLFASFLVNKRDDGRCKVENLLELLRRNVEQIAQTRRRALEVPNMAYRSSELDVAHALTTNLGTRNLNTAAFADDALEANALVLTAGALPVLRGAKDLFAEQAVLFGLERTIVDGFGLLNFATRPTTDIFSACKRDADGVEIVNVKFAHLVLLSLTDKVVSVVFLAHQIAKLGSDGT